MLHDYAFFRRPSPPPPPPPPPSIPRTIARTITATAPVVQTIRGGPTYISHYDPSRVIKGIKVVQDLRQSGTERGESQTGDDGYLGPTDTDGRIAPPRTGLPGAPGAPGEKNALIPLALLAGAFLLFGG